MIWVWKHVKIMLPKRRFWKAEQTFQYAFSKHFSRLSTGFGRQKRWKVIRKRVLKCLFGLPKSSFDSVALPHPNHCLLFLWMFLSTFFMRLLPRPPAQRASHQAVSKSHQDLSKSHQAVLKGVGRMGPWWGTVYDPHLDIMMMFCRNHKMMIWWYHDDASVQITRQDDAVMNMSRM